MLRPRSPLYLSSGCCWFLSSFSRNSAYLPGAVFKVTLTKIYAPSQYWIEILQDILLQVIRRSADKNWVQFYWLLKILETSHEQAWQDRGKEEFPSGLSFFEGLGRPAFFKRALSANDYIFSILFYWVLFRALLHPRARIFSPPPCQGDTFYTVFVEGQ